MAVVNPPINPINEPKYGNDSRAIDTPDPIRRQGLQQNQIMPEGQKIGDRSAEYTGQATAAGIQAGALASKGYGDLFANIVGIGDFLGKAGVSLVKQDIENKVYAAADQERQTYTAELEKLKQGGLKNILSTDATDGNNVPEAVSELPDTLATLKASRDGGKITKTDYTGRLLEHAKALRAQYPGFKQEIDEQFAKVTGQNPANARINQLITDINQAAKINSQEKNHVESFYKSNQGLPNMQPEYEKYVSGQQSANEFYSKFTPYKQKEEEMRMHQLKLGDTNATRTELDYRAKKAADAGLGTVVAASADMLLGKLGLTDPTAVETHAGMEASGSIPKKKWSDLNVDVANEITRLRVRLSNEMDKQGVTAKLAGGTDERNKKVEAALQPLKDIQDRVVNHDSGGIYEAAQRAKLILDQGKLDLLSDSKAGPPMIALANMKDLGGEQYLQKFNLEQALGKDGIPTVYKDWYKGFKTRMQTNAANPTNVVTFNDMFQEMTTKNINDPKINKNIVKEVEKIGRSDVPDDIKTGIAMSAFDPKNRGFLSKLNMDGYDERGRPVSGMNAVFQKWTSPEVTNEIKRLSKKNPALWDNYESWAQHTFGDELLQRELNTLKDYVKDPNMKISWDTENKRFDVTRTDVPALQGKFRERLGGTGYNSSEAVQNIKQFETVSASVNRINSGLYNLKNVALESNKSTDVDAYLLKAIATASGPEALKNIQGIPLDMLNKIMLGRAYGNRK